MGGRTTRDLFLNVSGSTDSLTTAMKAGRTALLSLGTAAGDVQAEVKKAFTEMNSSSIADNARAIEQSYTRSFDAIKRAAREAADAPTPQVALQVIDASAARQAAEAAVSHAAGLRLLADAAGRAAIATQGDATAARAYAASAEAAALGANEHAQALRAQAGVLSNVETEVRSLAQAQGLADVGLRKTTAASGQTRAGMQQLGYQMNDVATQFASGTSASIIFAQQSGQVIQALTLMTTKTSGFLGFLGGPWGIILSTAVIALAPMVSKLFESGDATDKAVDALKKHADQTNIDRLANIEWANSVDGVIDKTRTLTEELKKQILTQRQVNQGKVDDSQAAVERVTYGRGTYGGGGIAQTEDELQGARTAYAKIQKNKYNNGALGLLASAAAILAAEKNIGRLEARLKGLKLTLNDAQGNERIASIAVSADRVAGQLDAATASTNRFQDALGKLNKERAKLGGISKEEYESRRLALETKYKAEQEAAKAAKKTKREPSLGAQLRTEDASSLLTTANKYRGQSETGDRGSLMSLFKGAGMSVDPKITAWCAAFVNAVLATDGLKGTGSLSARSFLNYGTSTDKPVKGDIVVAKRGTGDQGHVGFYEGVDKNGRVRVLGGNTGNKVGTQSIARADILGFRRAPTAAADAKTGERAETKAARDEKAFNAQVGQAQDRIARAQLVLADTIENRYQLETGQLEAVRRQRDLEIDDLVKTEAINAVQAATLRQLNDRGSDLEKQAITRRQQQDVLDKQLARDRAEIDDKIALMNAQGALATTAEARRRVALQLLALEEQQLRDEAGRKLKSDNVETRTQGARDLAQVDALHPYRVEQAKRDTADPLENYGRRLVDATSNTNDALKQVKADGFQALEDGLVGLITGTESAAGAFKKMAGQIIADLARIAIQKAIISTIGKSFFGFSEGGAVDIQKNADGGFIRGAGSATSDSILSWLSNGEFVINAASTRRHLPLIKAINDNSLPRFATGGPIGRLSYPALPKADSLRADRGGAAPVNFDLRGAVMTADLLEQMNSIAAASGRAAAFAGANLAGARSAAARARQL